MTNSGVFLSNTESYKYQIIMKFLSGKIYKNEAALLLSVSERTISRYASKVRNKGIFGVKHGNCNNKINLKYDSEFKFKVIELYRTKYFDFNLSHFCEILLERHDISLKYITLWRWFSFIKLIKSPKKRRRKKHVYRQRMPQEGLLLEMDGCHHRFNGKDEWCLLTAIDDATSEIPYAEFFKGETTLSCLKVLEQIILKKGIPKAIYTDKAGWSGGGKRSEFSHFQRACNELGIQLIYANSPQAKGRIERSFRTIQDRLVPELRIAGITDMGKANEYLMTEFITKYWNKKKTVQAFDSDSAYTTLDPWVKLNEVLCLKYDRKVGSDQTVSFQGQRYVLSGSKTSAANLMATFQIDFNGELKVLVFGEELTATPVSKTQYDIDKKQPVEKIKNKELYLNMASSVQSLRCCMG